MWPPPNLNALPSKDEIRKIEVDILHLEAELLEARCRVATLENDIFARKAWIAPVRRLPHETLSLVFLALNMEDWKAPLTLQGVCRFWRNVLFDTPAAWSFIDLYEDGRWPDPGLLSKFLERSRNASMHIHFAYNSYIPFLDEVMSSKRIKCLEIGIWGIDAPMSENNDFSELEMLRLFCVGSYQVDKDKGRQFDMIHLFPNLRSLGLEGDEVIRMIALSPNLPTIQDLEIKCERVVPFGTILKRCAGSI